MHPICRDSYLLPALSCESPNIQSNQARVTPGERLISIRTFGSCRYSLRKYDYCFEKTAQRQLVPSCGQSLTRPRFLDGVAVVAFCICTAWLIAQPPHLHQRLSRCRWHPLTSYACIKLSVLLPARLLDVPTEIEGYRPS